MNITPVTNNNYSANTIVASIYLYPKADEEQIFLSYCTSLGFSPSQLLSLTLFLTSRNVFMMSLQYGSQSPDIGLMSKQRVTIWHNSVWNWQLECLGGTWLKTVSVLFHLWRWNFSNSICRVAQRRFHLNSFNYGDDSSWGQPKKLKNEVWTITLLLKELTSLIDL